MDDSTFLLFFLSVSLVQGGRKNAHVLKLGGRLKGLVGSPVEHDHHRSDSGRSGQTMERRERRARNVSKYDVRLSKG